MHPAHKNTVHVPAPVPVCRSKVRWIRIQNAWGQRVRTGPPSNHEHLKTQFNHAKPLPHCTYRLLQHSGRALLPYHAPLTPTATGRCAL